MSLATRCVACGTIFRVVQDQLKVSEGWVRCGRCDEVFNALEGLFDLDREAPPRWIAPPSGTAADFADGPPDDQRPTAATADAWAAEADHDTPSHAVDSAPTAGMAESPRRADSAESMPSEFDESTADAYAPPATQPGPRHAEPTFDPAWEPEPDSLRVDGHAQAADVFSPSESLTEREHAELAEHQPYSSMPAGDEPALLADTHEAAPPRVPYVPMPAFVARADRDARWRQPGRLAGMSALILLLVAMLGLQATHHYRDTVAARWPASRPALERWCEFANCHLSAPRRIEDIVVENTGLTRAVAGTDTYRLAVTLRNRGPLQLALPSIDVALTDNSGQLVARRALSPADFQRPAATIAGNSDVPLSVLIATGNSKVSGYTVEIFYP